LFSILFYVYLSTEACLAAPYIERNSALRSNNLASNLQGKLWKQRFHPLQILACKNLNDSFSFFFTWMTLWCQISTVYYQAPESAKCRDTIADNKYCVTITAAAITEDHQHHQYSTTTTAIAMIQPCGKLR
jgi:hypothetical protein